MLTWKIAGVQMDCRLGNPRGNLDTIRTKLNEAAAQGAGLIVFPECALTGYCFESKDEAWPHSESLPGPATEALAADCRRLKVWAIIGLLERAGDKLFNACALVGPDGLAGTYRKLHLPFLGVDRFNTRGDRPFAMHDLGGLRVGMSICYDGSFPESARILSLLGADLVILATNWPRGASSVASFMSQTRALENHIYYMAVNRIGLERGFDFIGRSQIIDYTGEILVLGSEQEQILYAEIDPDKARAKRVVKIPGKYELDRTADRRPEMYGLLSERVKK
ncbi:MAG: carbon-nitrogen hydrolase family protein [Gemmataceae bacterium]